MSIVDRERNAVSMTSTINGYFGAKFLSTSTGIILNNEMDDFSMPENSSKDVPPPAHSNFIHPGKRPLSSMTPTIILKVTNHMCLQDRSLLESRGLLSNEILMFKLVRFKEYLILIISN